MLKKISLYFFCRPVICNRLILIKDKFCYAFAHNTCCIANKEQKKQFVFRVFAGLQYEIGLHFFSR